MCCGDHTIGSEGTIDKRDSTRRLYTYNRPGKLPSVRGQIPGWLQGLRVLRARTGHHPDVSFLSSSGVSTDSIAAINSHKHIYCLAPVIFSFLHFLAAFYRQLGLHSQLCVEYYLVCLCFLSLTLCI